MFKGKNGIYILVPLNILIWGYTAYMIFATFKNHEAVPLSGTNAPAAKINEADSLTYILKLNYKDPFLKSEPVRPKNNSIQQNNGNEKKAPSFQKSRLATVEKKALDIKYMGFIENKTSGTSAAMVSVNGSSQVIRQGQVIDEVTFQTITSEFIIVKLGKEKITIKRS